MYQQAAFSAFTKGLSPANVDLVVKMLCQAPDANQPAYLMALQDSVVPSLEALLREPSVVVYYSQTASREALNAQLDKLRSELQFQAQEAAREKDKAVARVRQLEGEKVELQVAVEKERDARKPLEDKVAALGRELEKRLAEQDALRQQARDAELALKTELQQLRTRADGLQTDLAAAQAQAEQLRQTLGQKQIELTAKDEELAGLRAQCADLQARLDQQATSLTATNQNERKLQLALQNALDEAKHFRELYQTETAAKDALAAQLQKAKEDADAAKAKYEEETKRTK